MGTKGVHDFRHKNWRVVDHYEEETESTSRLAREATKPDFSADPDTALLVRAGRQSGGRGRRGNRWASPAGNIYMTLAVGLPVPVTRAGEIGMMTAICLADVLSSLAPGELFPGLKWPNDLLVNGRKIAGILPECEAAGTGYMLYLGIGLNVACAPDLPDSAYEATSLAREGINIDKKLLTRELACAVLDGIADWPTTSFSVYREKWLARGTGIGQKVTVRFADREISGRFVDLDEDGAMLLLRDGRQAPERVTAGEVFYGWKGGE